MTPARKSLAELITSAKAHEVEMRAAHTTILRTLSALETLQRIATDEEIEKTMRVIKKDVPELVPS